MRFGSRPLPFVAIALLLLAPHRLSAQEWRGTVRDSLSRQPISGAVVLLLDSSATIIARTLTDARGEYRVPASAGARRLELLRLGFRPARATLPTSSGDDHRIDISMSLLASLLEPVRVTANAHCPRRADEASTFALLEQARAGLQAIVAARTSNPADMVRLGYERRMDGTSDRVIRQIVRGDTATRSATSFDAVRTASEFGAHGFIAESLSTQSYLAPDADVLLDPHFANAYCFRIARPDRARPHQIGLGFVPAERAKGRVDVDGTLWVDTLARVLVDMEFQYVGFPRRVEALRPGGHVSFASMPNGTTLIDRWILRMVGAEYDTVEGRRVVFRERLFLSEGGGEVARAQWADGNTWTGSLGTLRVHAVTHAGRVAAGTVVRLWDTDYRAVADSAGDIVIPHLVPGPYELMVLDPALSSLRLQLATPVKFVAKRDSIAEWKLDVPTADDTTVKRCLRDHRLTVGDSVRILGRVMSPRGEPIADINVSLSYATGVPRSEEAFVSYRTGTDGLFMFCDPRLEIGLPIAVTAADRRGRTVARAEGALAKQLSVIPLVVETTQSPLPGKP